MSILQVLNSKKDSAHIPYDNTTEGMLEWLRQQGEPRLSTIDGNWWCWFRIKKGTAQLDIHGERFSEWTLHQAVASCYNEVRKAMNL